MTVQSKQLLGLTGCHYANTTTHEAASHDKATRANYIHPSNHVQKGSAFHCRGGRGVVCSRPSSDSFAAGGGTRTHSAG